MRFVVTIVLSTLLLFGCQDEGPAFAAHVHGPHDGLITRYLIEQRERVGTGPGKPGEDLPAHQAANFVRVGLHDRITQAHLAIATNGDDSIAANGQNGGRACLHQHFRG